MERGKKKYLNIYAQVLELLFNDTASIELTLFLYDGSKLDVKIYNN